MALCPRIEPLVGVALPAGGALRAKPPVEAATPLAAQDRRRQVGGGCSKGEGERGLGFSGQKIVLPLEILEILDSVFYSNYKNTPHNLENSLHVLDFKKILIN